MQDPDGKRLPDAPTQVALSPGARRIAAVLLSVVLTPALWSCQSTTEQNAVSRPLEGSSGVVSAEREDINAAMSHLQEVFEIAIVDEIEHADGDLEFRLVNITNDPIWIRFRLPSADPAILVEGDVTVRYGRFRNTQREEAILRELRKRLDWLADRD